MSRRKARSGAPKRSRYAGWADLGDHVTVTPPWGSYSGKIVACDYSTVTLKQADGSRIQINGRYHVERQSLLDVLAFEATAKKPQGGPC